MTGPDGEGELSPRQLQLIAKWYATGAFTEARRRAVAPIFAALDAEAAARKRVQRAPVRVAA